MKGTRCVEESGRIVFTNGELTLEIDRRSGRWLGMRDASTGAEVMRGGDQQAPISLSINGITMASRARHHTATVADAEKVGGTAACTAWRLEEDGPRATLVVETRDGDWGFEQRYALVRGKGRLDRSVRITYHGDGTALLRDMEVRVPPVHLGPWTECFIEAPGYPTRPHQPLPSLIFGEPWNRVISPFGHGAPGWLSGVVAIDNPSRSLALTVWTWDEVESCGLGVQRVDAGTRIHAKVDLAARMRKGSVVDWEGQHIQLTHGQWRDGLQSMNDWFEETGWRVPADIPAWGRSMHIYNVFVGTLPFIRARYPEYDYLIRDLPRIRQLGFDCVYFPPHVPYPGYDSEDYMDVEKQYGSGEGLRSLVKAAHELGMKVMLDMGIHGIIDAEMARERRELIAENRFEGHPLPEKHPDRMRHPAWFMQTETGAPAATYTWAFDHANEEWQDSMVKAICHYVKDFDVDAFRIDAPTWVPFPNWAEGLPHRASASIYGSVKLFEKARAAAHRVKPGVVFYSEAPGAVFTRGFDVLYNYDYQWLFTGLMTPTSAKVYLYIAAFADERITAADLAVWLEQVRLVKPRGSITVQHMDSADVHGWSNGQYRREVFGVPRARAFFGLMVALAGPLMMYAGAEEGMEEFYTAILRLKRALPALDRGAIEPMAVACDEPNVIAPLRTLDAQVIIPVIHFGDVTTTAGLTVPVDRLPASAQGAWQVIDRMSGVVLGGPRGTSWSRGDIVALRVEMGPFQVRYLEIVPVTG